MADSFINSTTFISDVCTKFQNPRSSRREIFDENFHIHYIGVRDRKRKIEKKAKINLSTLVLFSVLSTLGHPHHVYKI